MAQYFATRCRKWVRWKIAHHGKRTSLQASQGVFQFKVSCHHCHVYLVRIGTNSKFIRSSISAMSIGSSDLQSFLEPDDDDI